MIQNAWLLGQTQKACEDGVEEKLRYGNMIGTYAGTSGSTSGSGSGSDSGLGWGSGSGSGSGSGVGPRLNTGVGVGAFTGDDFIFDGTGRRLGVCKGLQQSRQH